MKRKKVETVFFFFDKLSEFNRKLFEEDDNHWINYFNSQFAGEEIKSSENPNISPGKGQYYLVECNFLNSNDGVLNFTNISNTLFLHNRCLFNNCTSEEDGSCIYYKPFRNSSIVQRKFCCTKCQSSKRGQFSYTEIGRNDLNLNFFVESSLFDVGNESDGDSVIYAYYGNILVSSTNFSSCKAIDASVGWFYGKEDINKTYNYSTFVDSKVTDVEVVIIGIYYNTLIDSCNIINNTISTLGVIFHSYEYITIKSCSFINNIGPEESFLIHNIQDKLTVDNCYIDDSIPKTFFWGVEPKNTRQLFTNSLSHLSTGDCQAYFVIFDKSIDIDNKFPLIFIALVNNKNSY